MINLASTRQNRTLPLYIALAHPTTNVASSNQITVLIVNPPRPPPSSNQHNRRPCNGCGGSAHTSIERSTKCPAWGQECRNCGIRNRFSNVCKQANIGRINLIAHVQYNTDLDKYTTKSKRGNEITTEITPNLPSLPKLTSRPLHIFSDSGSSICIVGIQHLPALGIDRRSLIPCNKH